MGSVRVKIAVPNISFFRRRVPIFNELWKIPVLLDALQL